MILCTNLLLWMRHGFTIIHQNHKKTKQSTEAYCLWPKKIKLVPSARSMKASVFWDAKGILLIGYLKKNRTVTGELYSNLLTKLDKKLVRQDLVCRRKYRPSS